MFTRILFSIITKIKPRHKNLNHKELAELYANFIRLYRNLYKADDIDVSYDVRFVDDIYSSALSLCMNDEECSQFIDNECEVKKLTGLLIQPTESDALFHLLIRKARSNITADLCRTVCHEYTHYIDYSAYMKKYNLKNLRKIPNIDDYPAFYFISEYRATCRGLLARFEYSRDMKNNKLYCENNIEVEYASCLQQLQSKISSECYTAFYSLARAFGFHHAINIYYNKQENLPEFLREGGLEKLYDLVTTTFYSHDLFPNINLILDELKTLASLNK